MFTVLDIYFEVIAKEISDLYTILDLGRYNTYILHIGCTES